jgi:hypothetical protein
VRRRGPGCAFLAGDRAFELPPLHPPRRAQLAVLAEKFAAFAKCCLARAPAGLTESPTDALRLRARGVSLSDQRGGRQGQTRRGDSSGTPRTIRGRWNPALWVLTLRCWMPRRSRSCSVLSRCVRSWRRW